MVEMETGIDPGPEDLVHQVPCVCESVLVKAIGEGLAIDGDSDVRSTEEVGNQG
jgi:hypothetical protein